MVAVPILFSRDHHCKSKYLREEELIEQLLGVLDQIDFNQLGMRVRFDEEFKRFNKFQRSVLQSGGTKKSHTDIDLTTYAKYILKEGTNEERRELMECFMSKIIITQGVVTVGG